MYEPVRMFNKYNSIHRRRLASNCAHTAHSTAPSKSSTKYESVTRNYLPSALLVSLVFLLLASTASGRHLSAQQVHSSATATSEQTSTQPDTNKVDLVASAGACKTVIIEDMVRPGGIVQAFESQSLAETDKGLLSSLTVEWLDADGLLGEAGVASSGGICPDDATLVMTGRVRYAEPGCSDEVLYVNTSKNIVCSSVAVELPPVVIPPPGDVPNVGGCSDRPLRRVRVELWQDNGLPGPGSGDTLLTSTVTDDDGLFPFCRTSAPADKVDLYVSVKTYTALTVQRTGTTLVAPVLKLADGATCDPISDIVTGNH